MLNQSGCASTVFQLLPAVSQLVYMQSSSYPQPFMMPIPSRRVGGLVGPKNVHSPFFFTRLIKPVLNGIVAAASRTHIPSIEVPTPWASFVCAATPIDRGAHSVGFVRLRRHA